MDDVDEAEEEEDGLENVELTGRVELRPETVLLRVCGLASFDNELSRQTR